MVLRGYGQREVAEVRLATVHVAQIVNVQVAAVTTEIASITQKAVC